MQTNVKGTFTLLEAFRQYLNETPLPASKFHHISTDEVFGSLEPADPAFSETTSYDPRSPYSASKAGSDHLVKAYHHTYGLPVTMSNCSNNYGPYHFPEKLIPLIITNALRGKVLPIYGDGKQVRDWLLVTDHCRGIELILRQGRLGESYNIGGCNEWHNIDIVKLVCGLLDEAFVHNNTLKARFPQAPAAQGIPSASLITYVTDRLGHDRRYAIDATKIERELGFKPSVTFEQGIAQTVAWYLANEAWWQPLVK